MECLEATLKKEGGDIMPGDTIPYDITFLLENEVDDVTFTITIFFNEEDGSFERTLSLQDLAKASAEAPEQEKKAGLSLETFAGAIFGQTKEEPDTHDFSTDAPVSIPEIVTEGKALLEGKAYEEALALYDAALAQQPDVAAYHGGRGEALLGLNRAEEALDALDTAISLDAARWEYFNERGVAYYYLDQTERALADLRTAVALNPDEDAAHCNLAVLQYMTGALDDAERTCISGNEKFPDSSDIHFLLGNVRFDLEDYDGALGSYNRAIALGGYMAEDIEYYAAAKRMGSPDSLLENFEEYFVQPYIDAVSDQFTILDSALPPVDLGSGLVEEAVAYPRAWPSLWLDGAIPPYEGAGWMYDLYVARPVMSYAAKDLLHVAVTVYEYVPEEVDAYIDMLRASGFEEVLDDRYAAEWIDSLRSFCSDSCTLNIIFGKGEGPLFDEMRPSTNPGRPQPFVQFNVDFFRGPYEPDTGVTRGTNLLNYAEWADTLQIPESERKNTMDTLGETLRDEAGRLYEQILYPSRWPKDIFGEVIPEFVLPGVMYYMEITAPADDPLPEKTLFATMHIIGYAPGAVQQYARELRDFGYREVPEAKYSGQEAKAAALCDQYSVFENPTMRVYLNESSQDGVKRLQIGLRFDGRYTVFNYNHDAPYE